MKFIFCYILLLLLIDKSPAQTPDVKFEHITKGLSNTFITYITQDKQGFMWFGTNDGLNRYDGYSFKQFKNIPGDPTSIANNNIIQIYQTPDEKIWVGTYDNMSVYEPRTGKFNTLRKGDNFNATGFYGYDNELLWVGSNSGLYTYNLQTTSWNKITLSNQPDINCSITKGDGDLLWICTWDGFYKLDIKTRESKKFYLPVSNLTTRPTNIIGSCTKDKQGFLWFTSWENGLHRFNPVTETFESFYDDPGNAKKIFSNITKRVVENSDGTIWIANSFGGLTIYNPPLQKTFNYGFNAADPFSLSGTSAESIFKDRDGNIWIGTDKGINKYSRNFNFFKTVRLINKEHPGGGFDYNALVQDKEGELWAGSFFGFYNINATTGNITEYSKMIAGIKDPRINDIFIDENHTLWAASSSCIYKINKINKNGSFQLKSTKIDLTPYAASIRTILQDDGTHLWLVGIASGIFRFDKISHEIKQFLPDTTTGNINNDVLCFARLDKENWLAGVRNSGLMLFNAITGSFNKIPVVLEKTRNSSPLVLDIYQDLKKNIWLATLSDGLIKTGPSLKDYKQYTEQDGLSSMRVYHVDEDKNGNIWLNTFGGLSVFNPVKNLFSNYGNNEGLRNQHLLHDFYKNEQGIFFMGDENCLQLFNPAERTEKNDSLPVYITGFKIQNKDYALNNPVILDYNRNAVTIEFVALEYTQSDKIKYAYKLEGAGNEWQSTGNLRSVSFSNLKEGSYTFKVRAAGINGVWFESKDSISFTIKTPFWKSWWFYLLTALAIAGAVYYLYRLKLNRIRNEEKIRDKIARDLHDDIGSTLSGINLYSKMALNKTNHSDEETKAILIKIEERTGNMMDAMSDIVWSINPHNDTVADMLVRMKEYAAEMLEAKEINYHFEADEMISSQKLDLNIRKEIFLVFKEAVNNAAKHSGCTEMVIEVSICQNKFSMIVKDNGKWIHKQQVKQGNGLGNMKARAKQVNGILSIESPGNGGTVIHLQVPLT